MMLKFFACDKRDFASCLCQNFDYDLCTYVYIHMPKNFTRRCVYVCCVLCMYGCTISVYLVLF